jgi:hypothetical protein
MPYEVILSPRAAADFISLPGPLQDFLEYSIDHLAENPVQLSRPSAFPYPPNAQLFQVERADADGERHFFTILFRYSQNETAIEVIGIGHQVLD